MKWLNLPEEKRQHKPYTDRILRFRKVKGKVYKGLLLPPFLRLYKKVDDMTERRLPGFDMTGEEFDRTSQQAMAELAKERSQNPSPPASYTLALQSEQEQREGLPAQYQLLVKPIPLKQGCFTISLEEHLPKKTIKVQGQFYQNKPQNTASCQTLCYNIPHERRHCVASWTTKCRKVHICKQYYRPKSSDHLTKTADYPFPDPGTL